MFDLITAKWQEKTAALAQAVAAEEALFAAKGKLPTDLLQARRAQVEWMKATETCVVLSQEQGEVAEFKKWRNFRDEPLLIEAHREKMVQRELEKEFKQAQNPFRIAIVCTMWLTGFDVQCLATLYLDKPMQGHTLMQAIARVNRVGGGKKHGLIIDYNGMLKSLRRALSKFAQGDRAGTGKGEGEADAVRDDSAALAEYADSLKQAREFLGEMGFDLDELIGAQGFAKQSRILAAANLLAAPDERRKTFEVINEDQLAVFDLLQKDTPTKGDREKIKQVARELLDKLLAGKLQIDHWREKAAAQAQVKAEIIKHLYAHLPEGVFDDDEISLKAGAVFAHLYTAGFPAGERVVH
jgi:type I restriction enzyme R subunit